MKTTLKQLAAGTFLAIILLTGNANVNGSEIKASGHESIENSLQLENWMTDEHYWNTNTINSADYVLESETGLELESWMTNTNTWSLVNQFAPETEAAMEVEGWMTSEELWNEHQSVVEEELEVEDWMTDPKVWK